MLVILVDKKIRLLFHGSMDEWTYDRDLMKDGANE